MEKLNPIGGPLLLCSVRDMNGTWHLILLKSSATVSTASLWNGTGNGLIIYTSLNTQNHLRSDGGNFARTSKATKTKIFHHEFLVLGLFTFLR